jgi:hypothetical protein
MFATIAILGLISGRFSIAFGTFGTFRLIV